MVEKLVPDTADDDVVAQYEVDKIGQADPKQHEANVSESEEDAIAAVEKHQEDMVEENVFEREVPIVNDIHHQENVPVWVDMMPEKIVRQPENTPPAVKLGQDKY